MCMGRNTGIKRIALYTLCVIMLFATWPEPVMANQLVVLAVRPLIARLIASRAAATVVTQTAANDAVYLTVARATAKPLSEKIAEQALRASSASRLSRLGKTTWAGLGVASGIMSIDEVMKGFDKEKISVVMDEDYSPDVEIKKLQPTFTNPVFVYSDKSVLSDVSSSSLSPAFDASGWKSDEPDVPATARFYICRGFKLDDNRKCYYGDNEEQVAMDYLKENYTPRHDGSVKSFEVISKAGGGLYPYLDGSMGLSDRLNVRVVIKGVYITQGCISGDVYNCVYGDVEKAFSDTQNVLIRINDHWAYGSTMPASSSFTPITPQTNKPVQIIGDLDSVYDKLEDNPPVLDVALLTRLINYFMMQAASSPDYKGIPFSSTDLFTEEEVNKALNVLNISPTQLELLSPVVDPVTNQVDITFTQNVNNVTNNVLSGGGSLSGNGEEISDVDLPEINLPDMQEPPGGNEILKPLLDLLPLEGVSLTPKNVACPVISFDIWEKHIVIDNHCELIERIRPLFAIFSLLIWSLAAFRVVFSA